MSLNLTVEEVQTQFSPRITVIGVGGAGGNAVNNMIQTGLAGVEFMIANTDAQAMEQSACQRCIQLGETITQGLGAGSRPDIGRAAAEEALAEVLTELEGTHMVFITAGMGGGTGTGAAPVLARAARDAGILTVGVVTKPFHFEGIQRMRLAENGIKELSQYVDTLIIIPNQNLFRIANEKTTFADAFKMADDVLNSGVRGVTDLMVMPGLINLDFNDIRSVMTEMGNAMMGTGEAEGPDRAIASAEAAISNPLLDDVTMKGAKGVLINITGGHDMTLFEVDETANRIRDEVDPEANIIFGSTFDPALEGRMRVSVVATGIDAEAVADRPGAESSAMARAVSGNQAAGEQVARVLPIPEQRLAAGAAIKADKPAAQAAQQEASPKDAPKEVPTEKPVTASEGQPSVKSPADAPKINLSGGRRDQAQPAAAKPKAPTAPLPKQEEDCFVAPMPLRSDQERAPEAPAAAMASAAQESKVPARATALQRDRAEAVAEQGSHFDRKRAQGLFAKMTSSAARALHAASMPQDQAAGAEAAGRREERVIPSLRLRAAAQNAAQASLGQSAQPNAAAAQRVSAGPAKAKPEAQPHLGLESAVKSPERAAEEDLLDIPAFLRRQAN